MKAPAYARSVAAACRAAPRRRASVAKQWRGFESRPGPGLSIGTCSCGCLQGAATLPASGPRVRGAAPRPQPPLRPPDACGVHAAGGRGGADAKLGLVVVGICRSRAAGRRPADTAATRPGWTWTSGTSRPAGARAATFGARCEEAVAARGRRREDAREDGPRGNRRSRSCSRWPPPIRRWIGSSSIPSSRRSCAKERPRSAVAGAAAPVVEPPRPLSRAAKCPADSPQCVPQDAPPDDGCGASLAWWFSDHAARRAKKKEAEAAERNPRAPGGVRAAHAEEALTRDQQTALFYAAGATAARPPPTPARRRRARRRCRRRRRPAARPGWSIATPTGRPTPRRGAQEAGEDLAPAGRTACRP